MADTWLVKLLEESGVSQRKGGDIWEIDEEHEVTLLGELGDSLVVMDRVVKVQIKGELAAIVGVRDTHYVPADRIVALRVTDRGVGTTGKRAGFV